MQELGEFSKGLTCINTHKGRRIAADGIRPTDAKTEAIKTTPRPWNVTELRSFLELLNYFGYFLPGLSTLLEPLHALLCKGDDWQHREPSNSLLKSCSGGPRHRRGVQVGPAPEMPGGQGPATEEEQRDMKHSYLHLGRALLTLGIISIFLGIIAFFPVFSYKPWFAGWSVRIACPIWNGAVAFIVGVLVLLAERDHISRSLRGVGFTIAMVNLVTSPVQFAVAMAAILIGPLCYYSLAGVSGQGYLGYVVQFPYRYALPAVCTDPLHYEYYHLVLHIVSLLLSLAIFSVSLTLCIRLTLRFIATGALSVLGLAARYGVTPRSPVPGDRDVIAAHIAPLSPLNWPPEAAPGDDSDSFRRPAATGGDG
uniref:uncharacterized protein n=1 Tax=Pristiophorus japonicus TaxID=55135 RepID=UPI00398E9E38